jgi:DNA-binding phage protein
VDKMPDIKMLKDKITDSGMTVKAVAEKSGILRETLYNRLKGVGEFTASEIVSLSNVLNLSQTERDDIFLK